MKLSDLCISLFIFISSRIWDNLPFVLSHTGIFQQQHQIGKTKDSQCWFYKTVKLDGGKWLFPFWTTVTLECLAHSCQGWVKPVPLLLYSPFICMAFLNFEPVSAPGLGVRIGRTVVCRDDIIQWNDLRSLPISWFIEKVSVCMYQDESLLIFKSTYIFC